MTTPDIFADGENEDSFFHAPSGQGDGPRSVVRTATVPASTAATTVIGLVPFNKGAIIDYGSALAVADLDTATTVTLDWGFIYDDDTTFTNDPDAFADGDIAGQSAAVIRPDEIAGATFKAEADGWIAVTVATGPTTTEGDITFNGTISYQG